MKRSTRLRHTIARVAAITSLATAAFAGPTPLPRVDGPIPVTPSSHPFLGASWQAEPLDLSKWGYVEEEYFLSGNANVYDYAPDKSLRILRAGPYSNRVIIRRPKDMRRFNGRALVEMLNASAGPDISFQWSGSYDFLMSNGYVYVGVTSKPYAAERLKQFDSARYGRLSWANPDPKASCEKPGAWAIFPGWSTAATEDGLLWDIVAQLGALLKSSDASNPLRAAPPQRLYLAGHSQSGAYVGTFARDFQGVAETSDGKPIFDGFMQTGSAGLTMLNQCAQTVGYDDPHIVMRSSLPFIRIMTLTDFYDYVPLISNFRLRGKQDSDAAGDLFRLYEVAGAEHSAAALFRFGAATAADVTRAGGRPLERSRCEGPAFNDFPLGVAFNTALEALDRWRDGIPAPHAARITMDRPGDPAAKPLRDNVGNVLGGFRTPVVDVPIAGYFGKSYVKGDQAPDCLTKGYSVPLSEEQRKTLYSSHATYVSKIKASVSDLTAKRLLTRWDGQRFVEEATRSKQP